MITTKFFGQIENEYGNIEHSFGQGGKEYMKWAAGMALALDAGVPWVMCKQTDAPENIVRTHHLRIAMPLNFLAI